MKIPLNKIIMNTDQSINSVLNRGAKSRNEVGLSNKIYFTEQPNRNL